MCECNIRNMNKKTQYQLTLDTGHLDLSPR
jgi:hypothetical protein